MAALDSNFEQMDGPCDKMTTDVAALGASVLAGAFILDTSTLQRLSEESGEFENMPSYRCRGTRTIQKKVILTYPALLLIPIPLAGH